MNNLPRRLKSINILLALLLIVVSVVVSYSPPKAQAATFAYVFLDRITATTTTGGTICAKPATTGTEDTVKVTFPSDFTVNGTASNWTVSTSNLPTSISGTSVEAWPSIATATNVSSQTVTFPSGDLTVAHVYCFRFASSSTLTTGSATSGTVNLGTLETSDSGGPTVIDSEDFGMAIVGSGNDQIAVTSTVAARFTFALANTSCSLGTLPVTGTPATCSSAPTMTISTNAPNGFNSWIKSANAGLTSSTTSTTIPSSGTYDGTPTSISSAEGYQLNAVATSGSPTIAAEYLDAGTTTTGGFLGTNYEQMAYKTAATASSVVTLNVLAEAGATRPPASDYNDTLTVVASGSF